MYVDAMMAGSDENTPPTMDDPSTVRHPSLVQIETAIRRLDGRDFTTVILGRGLDGEIYMGIAGGNDRRYLVNATPDNKLSYHLVTDGNAHGTATLTIGGQDSDFPLRMCVGLEVALQAALHYAKHGALDPALTWELQP